MDKIFESYWALRITALILAFALFFYAKADMDTNRDTKASTQTDIIYDVPLEVYYDDTNLIVTDGKCNDRWSSVNCDANEEFKRF